MEEIRAPINRSHFKKDKWDATEIAEYLADERSFHFPEEQLKLLKLANARRHNGGYFIFKDLNTDPKYVAGPYRHNKEGVLEKAFEIGLDNLFLVKDDLPAFSEYPWDTDPGFDTDPTFWDIYVWLGERKEDFWMVEGENWLIEDRDAYLD